MVESGVIVAALVFTADPVAASRPCPVVEVGADPLAVLLLPIVVAPAPVVLAVPVVLALVASVLAVVATVGRRVGT